MTEKSQLLKRLGSVSGPNDNNGYVIAVAFTLVFIAALATGYFVYLAMAGSPEPFTTIYVLNSERTLDLPETVVIGQNNTFSVLVTAENHMGKTLPFEIRLKIAEPDNTIFPVDTEPKNVYSLILENGGKSEESATVSIGNPGSYMVVFELWTYEEASVAKFTGNACILNIEAVSQ